jgi:hypothetical protein
VTDIKVLHTNQISVLGPYKKEIRGGGVGDTIDTSENVH